MGVREAATPPGSEAVWGNSGGVARASLNPRLMAGIPPGWRVAGGVVAGVSERGWRVAGVAEVTGLSEPGYNGGGAGRRWGGGGAGRRWGGGLAGFMGVEKGGLGLGGSFAFAMRGVRGEMIGFFQGRTLRLTDVAVCRCGECGYWSIFFWK